MLRLSCILLLFVLISTTGAAQEMDSFPKGVDLKALAFRNIGPAINGGRIADIEVHPDNSNIWYVAVGSGNVWKTENAGTTWQPIFENEGSYSTGFIELDPQNPDVLWLGTGEDVGGRHVGYGNGLYKSEDGGQSWKHMGLEESDHISTIIVHPTQSDIVYVCAEGPLWSKGGQRGLYKTTDGGENWQRVLGDDEWTGVTDLLMDPRDPDLLYAATWERHRTVAAYMGGGPGSGIHKSTDGGESWEPLKKGLPTSNLGKIGLAINPHSPDMIYAAIELDRRKGGVYRSTNRGASWEKMSDAVAGGTGPHYYQELYASPHREGEIYLVSNYTLVSKDHGRNFDRINVRNKHVDDHAIAFRPEDPNYIIIGTDGGLFESFDRMNTWRFIDNLPVMQYYKISVDDARPFYNVYGGTQDNGSNGGPSRTDKREGITNADWGKTLFADGHGSATEPGNPNIVYAETQKGGLYRVHMNSGDQVSIQPQARKGEPHERYNWDAPIEISPHSPQRLYFASQRVWRSDNRGNAWTPISGDLTRNEERIELPILGKQKSWDNPWDLYAMSYYNTITSLSASPLEEGLIYAGTDDGLLQVTEDGGDNWRKIDLNTLRGIKGRPFVNDIKADQFDQNTVYIALDRHKEGDYSPYIYKSTDRGKSWKKITEGLPDRHIVWRVVQDHENPDLLFAGTEFGVFVTLDGGKRWHPLSGGLPTIAIRDLRIQKDQNDLVAGSFGRGIYILDDYTPLRQIDGNTFEQQAALYTPRDAYWYRERSISSSQGDDQYRVNNPPHGPVFTYYLRDSYKSPEEKRKEQEGKLEEGEDVPFPGWDSLAMEQQQPDPVVQLVISDLEGRTLRKIEAPKSRGLHRMHWDMHSSSKDIIPLDGDGRDRGFMVMPGTYAAHLLAIEDGKTIPLADTIQFNLVPLRERPEGAASPEEMATYENELYELRNGLSTFRQRLQRRIQKTESLLTAMDRADTQEPALRAELHQTRKKLLVIQTQLSGNVAKNEVGEYNPPSPSSRSWTATRALSTIYGPTTLHRQTLQDAGEELSELQQQLTVVEQTLPRLQQRVQNLGGPGILEID